MTSLFRPAPSAGEAMARRARAVVAAVFGLVLAGTIGIDRAAAATPAGGDPPPAVRIGFVVGGPWPQQAAVQAAIEDEIQALTAGEFDVRFPAEKLRIADWTLDGIERAVDDLLADPEVDLLVAEGPLASHVVCRRSPPGKPVVANLVLDPELQDVPLAAGASGVPDLGYVLVGPSLKGSLERFLSVVAFRHVTILVHRPLIEAIPGLVERTAEAVAELGVGFAYVPVGDSASEALAALPPATEAVFLTPLSQLSDAESERLIAGLNERRLPTFSLLDTGEVSRGALAGLVDERFRPRLARRVALDVQRILLGEDAGTLPVAFELRGRLAINLATARAIGASPRWEVLIEADVVDAEDPARERPLSLWTAIDEAVTANLDLAAGARRVAAGEQEVAAARAPFRPRLEGSAGGRVIDEDRAAASFGSQPERVVSAGATLSQLIWSEPARANLSIETSLQTARERELDTLRLDVALDAASTYLDVLRARSLERIRRDNLELTRTNLELARVRRSIGTVGPAEVYRWESQIAADRRALVDAGAVRRVAEIALDRLLHRPLDERFSAAEVALDDPRLLTGQEGFDRFTDTPRAYRRFTDFLVAQERAQAPELARLDAAIAAQERALTAVRRSFWSPAVAGQASVDELLSKGGAGASGSLFGGALPGLPGAPDDTAWSLGVSLSLPLYTGGSRAAERARTSLELERLRLERAAADERLEQRLRSALEAARASYLGIDLSRRSAEAARKNRELVTDAYARGVLSILDLLDAQNTALVADELAANAVYDFLIDLMEAQRAGSCFDCFFRHEQSREWLDRLERYFADDDR